MNNNSFSSPKRKEVKKKFTRRHLMNILEHNSTDVDDYKQIKHGQHAFIYVFFMTQYSHVTHDDNITPLQERENYRNRRIASYIFFQTAAIPPSNITIHNRLQDMHAAKQKSSR